MGYELPEVVNPQTVTFCIEVPDEEIHLRAFWGALWALSRPYNWDNDDDHTALEVGAVWRDLWFKNHTNWRERECMPCGDELCDKLDRIIELMEGGFKIVPLLSGIPDESGGKCAPDHFDHDGDSETELELTQRRNALCITIERYIKGIVLAALRDMGAPDFLVDYIQSVLASDVPLSLSALEVSYPVGFSGLSVFFLLASTVASFEALLCLMLDGLTGDKRNTSANFKASLPDIAPEGFPEGLAPLLFLVRQSNMLSSNYKAFNVALNDAKEEDLDGYECPCEPEIPDEPVIVAAFDIEGTPLPSSADLVITNLGGGNYRFEQNTPTGSGRYAVMFKDQYDRCIHMGAPTAGQGSLAAFSYFYTDCDGIYQDGTGGGRPDAIISGEDYSSPADIGWLITLV